MSIFKSFKLQLSLQILGTQNLAAFLLINIKVKIKNREMLSDIQSKYQFTVLTEQTKISCPCGNYDSYMLRQKLQEILNSLSQQLSSKDNQIQRLHKAYQQNIKQKEEIIQRLVSANSKLAIDNQQLTKKLSKSLINFKATISAIEGKWQAKTKQMTSVIEYLQDKNEQLRKQVMHILSLVPEQSYSFEKNLNNINNIKSARSSKFMLHSQNKIPRSPRVSMQIQSHKKNNQYASNKFNRGLVNNQNTNNDKGFRYTMSSGFSGFPVLNIRSKSVSNRHSLQHYN